MTTNEAFGLVMKQLRKERKWSGYELAFQLESDQKYISDVECGKRNVSLAFFERVARVFGLRCYELAELVERKAIATNL